MAASPDLDDERAELVGVLREAIERDRYFMSPPAGHPREVRSAPTTARAHPSPKPRGTPSAILARKRRRPR